MHDSKERYGLVTIGLHWLMAVLLITVFGLGLWMDNLSIFDANYRTAVSWHTGLGVMIAALLVVRIIWRVKSTTPQPVSTNTMLTHLARRVRVCLYLCMVIAVGSGYCVATGSGRELDVFGLFALPSLFHLSASVQEQAKELHLISVWALVGFTLLHVAAAFWHQFVMRDKLLQRILP